MLFNSFDFLAFLGVVYTVYLATSRWLRLQNAWLLAASLFFYGYWDWRFLGLIVFTIVVNFGTALGIHNSGVDQVRRRYLVLALIANLLLLGFFKYFNFFADNAVKLLNAIGVGADRISVDVILPVGISFYTFQALSYVVDVYRKEIRPTKNILDLGLYISFFPQLVAGPIERARTLLPQVTSRRTINWEGINSGLSLLVWGYFKKVVIADNVALVANKVFDHYARYEGGDILIGALAFTLQIYCDFSAYSDIARGLAKLMGFELMVNFRLPYFARNPSDFWQRWHISLSSWLRDYLYIPLGGNRHGSFATYRNLALTMLLGGLWHGAAWTFVIWGCYHGVILIAYRFLAAGRSRAAVGVAESTYLYRLRVAAQVSFMFTLTVVGWVIFRSQSAEQVWGMFGRFFGNWAEFSATSLKTLILFGSPLLLVQAWQYVKRDLLVLPKLAPYTSGPIYAFLLACIITFGVRDSVEFLYFQF